MTLKHRFSKVHQTIAGGFRANQAAAEGETFTSKHAGGVVREFFHHPGHKADFTAAHADIACRYVGVGAQMTIEFGHQRLAEAHHFAFAFAFRIEVRTAFTAAHRQGGQGIFEGLFEAEEFENRAVYRRVEAHSPFVRPNRRTELHAPCAVNLYLITVVYPHDAELNNTLRLN